MRVVLDTTLLVSLALSPRGPLARIRHYLQAGHFAVLTTAYTLGECGDALLHPSVAMRHGLTPEAIGDLLILFSQEAIHPTAIPHVSRDPHNDALFACALEGEADFIVSDNPALRDVTSPPGPRVISSGAFLAILEAEGGETP